MCRPRHGVGGIVESRSCMSERADVTPLRVQIDDGEPGVYVEFDVDADDAVVAKEAGRERLSSHPGSERGVDVVFASHSLSASLDQVKPALSKVMSKLREAVDGADEISVELGLRVGGETGLVFVKGSADAAIRATVTWRRPPDSIDER
jgi:hypothetical protein